MSQDVRTAPPRQRDDDILDDSGTGMTVSVSAILDRIWGFLISRTTGLVLILLTGLYALAGTLLDQAPAGMLSDPQAYRAWLDGLRPKYAGWTTILDKLGLLHAFSSIGFKIVIGVLMMSILACSINRTPKLWRQATRPRVHRSETFFAHAPLRATIDVPGDPDARLDEVRAVLRQHRLRVVTDPDASTRGLFADQFRWGPFGTILAHLSFVLIGIGMVITASTGFKDTGFAVPVGSRVAVGHATGLAVEAKSFSDQWYLDGTPKDYASDVVLYQNGKPVTEQTIRVNHPLRWGGVSFYQSFYGQAAAMRVTDTSGRTLYDASVPLQWATDDQKHIVGQIQLPGQQLSVYVVSPASGEIDPEIPAGEVQLEVYNSGSSTPLTTQVISQGKPTAVSAAGNLTFTFVRELQFTGLIVAHDPGAAYVWAGSTLMVLGLIMVFFFPHRRMWVRLSRTGDGTRIALASPLRRDVTFKSRFARIATDIEIAAGRRKVGPEDA